ncbi:alpha/beta hydrolase [Cryptosporangium phraense]|uniref:Alpha/beta hydrolase n=1 Tax=Cryptosporangium phraense TaxID=2593070 RepID=A0A545AKV9_9ACTN|nr:alpha/beta hydrolase [Cryptosporangium phraense]TQS41956.1 alpha/beta hydrolase [Cryptosporangium phraense]
MSLRTTVAGAAGLLHGVTSALNTANALRSYTGPGRASIPSFAAGALTSELPVAAAAATLLPQLGLAAAGGLRTRTGQVGLALSLAAAAGLVSVARASDEAPAILDDALTGAFGLDYRRHVRHPARPDPDAPLGPRPGVVRTFQVRRRYALDVDIPYGPAGLRNHLDVWRRPDLPRDGKAPVLVQVHGGAWTVGNKREQALPLLAHLTERGWVCVSVNYRLGPRATWPDMIVDVKRAVAWVKENIASYGGDPSFVAITGGSAGGHLTALHALTAPDRRWQPGFEDVDTSVVAAVPFYGVYDWTDEDDVGLVRLIERSVIKQSLAEAPELFRAASPRFAIRSDAPPFFVLHGTNDSLVPVRTAREFAAELRGVSASPVAYAEFPGAQHAFEIFSSPRAHACAEAVERFLGLVYGAHRAPEETASA